MKAFQDSAAGASKKAEEACKDVDTDAGAQIVAAAQQEALTKMETKLSEEDEAASAAPSATDPSGIPGFGEFSEEDAQDLRGAAENRINTPD